MIGQTPRSTLFPYSTLFRCQGSVLLGRSEGCGVHLADPDVSRRHALVSVCGGRVTVADLGSSNGSSWSSGVDPPGLVGPDSDRKSTRLNSSHANISYAVFCL